MFVYCKRFGTSASLMSFFCSCYRAVCLGDLIHNYISASLTLMLVLYCCLLARLVVSYVISDDLQTFATLIYIYPLYAYLFLSSVIYSYYFVMNWLVVFRYSGAYAVFVAYFSHG